MAKKLNKGLNEIFGNDIDSFIDDINGTPNASGKMTLSIKEIRPNPYQPRKEFNSDALNELANSIKENGVIQPVIVRKSLQGYELVAGERRLRASKLAGLKEIPVIIGEQKLDICPGEVVGFARARRCLEYLHRPQIILKSQCSQVLVSAVRVKGTAVSDIFSSSAESSFWVRSMKTSHNSTFWTGETKSLAGG